MSFSFYTNKNFDAGEFLEEVCKEALTNDELKKIVHCLSSNADNLYRDNFRFQNEIAKACTQISDYYKFEEGKATAKYLQAKIHTLKGESNATITVLKDAHTYFEQNHNKDYLSKVNKSLAEAYVKTEEYNLAIDHFNYLLVYYTDINDLFSVAETYANLGECFYAMSRFSQSLQHFKKTIDVLDTSKGYSKLRVNTYFNIAVVYQNAKQPMLANTYYTEVSKMLGKQGNHSMEAKVAFYRGKLYLDLNELALAEIYVEKSLKIREKENEIKEAACCYQILGDIYCCKKDFKLARRKYITAYNEYFKLNDLETLSNCCVKIAELSETIGDYKLAYKYQKEGNYFCKQLFEKKQLEFDKTAKENENKEVLEKHKLISLLVGKTNSQDEIISNFVNNLTHNLKNPSRTVVHFIQKFKYAQNQNAGKDELNDYLNKITNSGILMNNMIDDLRDYTLLPTENIELNVHHLNVLFNDIQLNLSSLIEKEKARIIIDNNLPEIYTCKTKFTQLFQHLIANAIKFRKEYTPIVVSISVAKVNNKLSISVEDNGLGIAKDNQTVIFDIFKRIPTNKPTKGTGMGLAICKRICDELNMTIKVDSQPAIGSTFTIDLPLNMLA